MCISVADTCAMEARRPCACVCVCSTTGCRLVKPAAARAICHVFVPYIATSAALCVTICFAS